MNDGRSFGEGCGAEAIFGRGDRSFIKKDVGPAKFLGFDLKTILGVVNRGSKSRENLQVGVEATSPDAVASRAGEGDLASASKEGSCQSDRAA